MLDTWSAFYIHILILIVAPGAGVRAPIKHITKLHILYACVCKPSGRSYPDLSGGLSFFRIQLSESFSSFLIRLTSSGSLRINAL